MESLLPLLDALNGPQAWLLTQPREWLLLGLGLILAAMLGAAGFVLARLGYRPYWALLLLVPTVGVAALWWAACRKFPREKLGL